MLDTLSERPLPLSVVMVSLLLGLAGMSLAGLLGGAALIPALLLGHTALLAPFALSAAALRIPAVDAFAVRALPARDLLFAALCGAGLWMGSAGLLQLQYVFWPVSPEILKFFEALHGKLPLWPPWSAALSLLAIALWPAIVEEVVFRGALLGSLRTAVGDGRAVVLSAAIFGLIHVPPGGYRVPFTFALGLALGALRLRTRSIVPAIVAHAVVNATTVILTAQLDGATDPGTPAPAAAALAILALGAAFGVTTARAIRPATTPGSKLEA